MVRALLMMCFSSAEADREVMTQSLASVATAVADAPTCGGWPAGMGDAAATAVRTAPRSLAPGWIVVRVETQDTLAWA